MAGNGGDAPPLPSSNGGGEFLLSLLQKAPHHHFTQQPRSHHQHQPSPNLDPAVAAVGPTLLDWGSPSNGRDHFPHHRPIPAGPTSSSSSSLWPTTISHQSPPPPPPAFNNFLGFPQNPYPSSSSPPQFGTHQFNQFADELREQKLKLAYLTRPEAASVASGASSDIANLTNGFDRGLRLNPAVNYNSMEQHSRGGGAGHVGERGKQVQRTMPPPGFGNKAQGGSGGNWDIGTRRGGDERNVGSREMQGSGGFARNWEGSFKNERARRRMGSEDGEVRGNVDGRKGLSAQIDRPGPPAAVNLHSVSASEIESMMSVAGGGGESRRKDGDGVEDVGLHEVEDGGREKNEGKQHHKDSRSDDRGQHQLTQRMRHIKKQTLCRFDIERLNAPFLELFESLIPTEEEKAKQKRVLTLLENIICKEWPDARLYIYGSCGNSFGVSKSDIDLCLAIGKEDINKCEILLRLAELLESDKLENVQALTRARVPIVKLMDPVTGISCDICINNVLAVVNTKLLRDYANIDARLRQLAFIVKHWAKSRGVNETYHGTLSSYAYVLMCIHFLQLRRILPCLQGMRPTYSVTVENIECAFFDQVDKLQDFGSHNTESIAELVWAFFHYWAYSHDYANTVISIRRGRTISKREKDWTRRIGNDRHLICIEDPFETSHDLGRVVDKYSIKVLREEFERAAEILQHDANPCVKLFEPYVPSIQPS